MGNESRTVVKTTIENIPASRSLAASRMLTYRHDMRGTVRRFCLAKCLDDDQHFAGVHPNRAEEGLLERQALDVVGCGLHSGRR